MHLAVGENGDAVGNLPQQVQVMRNHDNGQAEQVAQFAYQFIDFAGTLGIEPGSWFVEKKQFGVERQGAGKGSPFQHAATEFGRILCADLWRQAGHRQLPVGNLIDQPVAKVGMFAQRQADIFLDRQRAEQATMLEHDAPALAQGKRLIVSELVEVHAEHPDSAGVRALQQDHLAQQGRFAGAAATDQREYFRPAHLEIEFFMHDMLAIARRYLADLDHRRVVLHVRGPAH